MIWNRTKNELRSNNQPSQAPPQNPSGFPGIPGHRENPLWLVGYALSGLLIVLLILSFRPDYFRGNFQQAKDFLLSPHFPFLCLSAILLCWKGIPESRYNLLVATLTSIYLALFYGDFLTIFHMSGDSVCQVAYWKVLWHPNLQGGIGVAFTKPGQVLYLGLLSQLALLAESWGGAYLFKAGLILAMAACVWSLVRIATDLGGRVAGLLAFLLATWAFLNDFLMSESTIYFIATLFSGLRLYYYRPRRRSLGRLLLVAALQFRIETIAILAVIGLDQARRREWRELRLLTAFTLASLAFFVLVVFQIQGDLARFNSGAAVGYVSPVADAASAGGGRLTYIYRVMAAQFNASPMVRFLSIATVIGMAGAFTFRFKPYLIVFAGLIVIVANVLFLGGTFNLERYVAFIYAFACSVGSASLVLFLRAIPRGRWRPLLLASGGGFILALLLTFDYSPLNTYKYLDPAMESGFLRSAVHMVNNPDLPAGSRLLSEDDLLSHLVVLDPDRYRKLASLQLFNVSSAFERKRILTESDYIWVELERYYYYYLFYLDNPSWRTDPFRVTIQNMLMDGRQQTIYDCRLVPIAVDGAGLLVKVEKSLD